MDTSFHRRSRDKWENSADDFHTETVENTFCQFKLFLASIRIYFIFHKMFSHKWRCNISMLRKICTQCFKFFWLLVTDLEFFYSLIERTLEILILEYLSKYCYLVVNMSLIYLELSICWFSFCLQYNICIFLCASVKMYSKCPVISDVHKMKT